MPAWATCRRDVAPDVRSRSYLIEADVHIGEACEGVLIAHGDATTGYSLYLQSGHLVHDMNIGGEHVLVRSDGAGAAEASAGSAYACAVSRASRSRP